MGLGFELRPPSLLLARRPRNQTDKKSPAPEETTTQGKLPTAAPPAPADQDLGFDLLGPADKAVQPTAAEDGRVKRRRTMLTLHPLFGIGLLACETATIVVGQLNYSDRFGGGPSSGRYEQSHKILAFTTAGLFAATGLLAVLAPNPLGKEHQGFDRVLLHKIGMATATAGMVAEILLGLYTVRREGYQNQASFAKTHLIIGYSTLAATYVGVGSIVF